MRPVYPSSPTALAIDDPIKSPKIGIVKYPWRSLAVGQSFLVAKMEANYTTINTSCYKWSKKLGRRFRAINHGEDGIEVARLSDSVGKVEFLKNFKNSA